MGQRRRHPQPVGRPPKILDEQVQTRLLQALRLGVPISLACQAADLADSTYFGWMQRGRDAFEDQVEGHVVEDTEQPYLDLFLATRKARADAAVRNVGVIQKAANGGQVTEETTRKYRDPDTGELVTETTVKRTAPDWRASAWYLERSHRQEFGRGAEQVEITGANGGPIEVTVDAEDLSKRLSEHLAAGVAATAALTTGHDDDGEMLDS